MGVESGTPSPNSSIGSFFESSDSFVGKFVGQICFKLGASTRESDHVESFLAQVARLTELKLFHDCMMRSAGADLKFKYHPE